jgi:hypothetical protein
MNWRRGIKQKREISYPVNVTEERIDYSRKSVQGFPSSIQRFDS